MKITKKLIIEMIEEAIDHQGIMDRILDPKTRPKAKRRPSRDTSSPFRDRKTAAATDRVNPVKEADIDEASTKSTRRQFSKIKPWESAIVFFDKSLSGTPPIPPRMVRIKASVDGKWTGNLKKNYQQNNLILKVMQDTIDLDGKYSAQPIYININGKFLEPDDEGRFWDVDSWILQKKGLTDKYSNLIDNQGNILATKKQQNKWSGV